MTDGIQEKLDYIERKMDEERLAAARKLGEAKAYQEAERSAFNEAKRLRLAELEKYRCPRCRGFIPTNENPGAYPGALSRCTRGKNDEPLYVCSRCGTDEGMLQFATGTTPSPDEWPVARQFELPEAEVMALMIDKLKE